ncbi:zinc finger protein 62-like [Teleopsis dalmanni]|uniref:zinc finger protein 62-like n=1 Tax=Teleopsis dalmanni TaxID=139649 RepID=UPI0018CDBAFD|nr:zinc finger protein 62-like [Teleopsis dalmanni]
MSILNNKNLQELCRTCLSSLNSQITEKKISYNVYVVPNLSKLLILFTSVDLNNENEDYPNSLCQLCYDKLLDFQSFRDLALKSAELLYGFLKETSKCDSLFEREPSKTNQKNDKSEKKSIKMDHDNYDNQLLLPELLIKSEPIDEELQLSDSRNVSGIYDSFVENYKTKMEINNVPENNGFDTTYDSIVHFNKDEVQNCKLDVNVLGNNIPTNEYSVENYKIKSEIDSEYEEDITFYENNALGTSYDSIGDDADDEEHALRNGDANSSSILLNASSSPNKYNTSRKRDRNKKSLKCPRCDKQVYKQVYLDAHIRGVHEGHEKPFLCSECQKAFTRYNQLHIHIQSNHILQQKFICGFDGCEATFKMITTLETHKKVVHLPDAPSLEDSLQEVLEMHQAQLNKEIEMDHICKECFRKYSSKRALTQHLKRHAQIKEHICKVCGVAKVTRTELQTHMRTHEPNLEKFKCTICPQEFNHKNAISRHVRVVHEGQRRFQCGFCSKRFGTRRSQICHERLHTGEKPYICDLCSKCFAQMEGLKSHMKNHDKNLRKHVCSFCSQRFITRQNLFDHENRHRGDKPHICNICSKGFYKSDDLFLHRNLHSTDDNTPNIDIDVVDNNLNQSNMFHNESSQDSEIQSEEESLKERNAKNDNEHIETEYDRKFVKNQNQFSYQRTVNNSEMKNRCNLNMSILNNKNLQELCRTCLSSLDSQITEEKISYNVYVVPNLSKLLILFTSVDVNNENEEYPNSLCQLCYDKLLDFQSFRDLALKSAELLYGFLKETSKCDSLFEREPSKTNQKNDKSEKKSIKMDHDNYDNQLLLPELLIKSEPIDEELQLSDSRNVSGIYDSFVENYKTKMEINNVPENNGFDTTYDSIVHFNKDEVQNCKLDVNVLGNNIPTNEYSVENYKIKSEIDSEYEEDITFYENNALGTSYDSIGDDADDEEHALRNGDANSSSILLNASSSPNKYNTSRKRDRNKKSLKCPRCDKQVYKQVYLDAHIRGVHEGHEKPFLCSECQKAFTRYNQLHIHIQSNHILQQKFICGFDGCEATFKMITTLETHKKVVHLPDAPSLEDSLQEVLEMHQAQLNKEIEMDHICKECFRKYSSKRALTQHLKRHAQIKEHICKVCGVAKVTRTELQTHMRTHEPNLEKFKCTICPQEFNHKNAISRHVRVVHEGQRRFQCGFCSKRFGTRRSQICHERLHTGEKPYICDLCSKCFAQMEGLKSHMKNHDKNLRKHVCSFCSQRFITRQNLFDHENRHRGDKPHICNICSKGFYKSDDLFLHRNLHSTDDNTPNIDIDVVDNNLNQSNMFHNESSQDSEIQSEEESLKERNAKNDNEHIETEYDRKFVKNQNQFSYQRTINNDATQK